VTEAVTRLGAVINLPPLFISIVRARAATFGTWKVLIILVNFDSAVLLKKVEETGFEVLVSRYRPSQG
jgi:hypothetical protein